MTVQQYILKRLANVLVSSGANPSWVEYRIKKKLGEESIPNEVKPNALFDSVSVGKLAVAGDNLAKIPDADKAETDPPDFAMEKQKAILAEIGYLENKHEWSYPKHSPAGRMQWVAYLLIALSFSLYEVVNYATVTDIAQHHQYWGYALLFLLLVTLSSVILWFVENIKLGEFWSCLISSFLLALMAKICKCVIPVGSEKFAFSLLWGSMVILVVGIKFVRGVLDFALHHYEQAKNELFSAIRDSAALSLGLFASSFIFCLDFVHGCPEKLPITNTVTYLVEVILVGLGSVGFFLCFSAALVNGDHKKLFWLAGWIFVLGIIAGGICALVKAYWNPKGDGTTGICTLVKAYWNPKSDDTLKDLLSALLVSAIIYLISKLILYWKDVTWPTEILFVPSIVVVVPGCGLCKKVSDLLLIALAVLAPTITIHVWNIIRKKCKDFSIATCVRHIEWKSFFSDKKKENRKESCSKKPKKWWTPLRGDELANDYKVWQYLTTAVDYIRVTVETGESEAVLARAAKSIVNDKVENGKTNQTKYSELYQYIGSVIVFLCETKNSRSCDIPTKEEIEKNYSILLGDGKYKFAANTMQKIVPVLELAGNAKAKEEDIEKVISGLSYFLYKAISEIQFPTA